MGVTFITLAITAGFRSASSVLIIPLEEAFGWGREQVSLAVAINVLVYGLVAPFAAALMERFGIRRVVMSALFSVSVGAGLTIFMNAPWQLMALWGFVVGASTGSLALVFAATVANRWFVQKRGIVIGALTASSATGQLIFLPGLSHIAEMNGWKNVSLTITFVALVLIPFVWLFLKERPQDAGVLPYGAPADWVAPAKSSMGAGALAIDTLKQASKKKDFWYLFGSFFVCGLSTAASLLALVGVFDLVGTIASGWLTDKYDPRKLLFFYYGFRGLSLLLLPSILFATVHPSTLVFVIFYGLDWVATVPPTIMLCRTILGPERATVVYGWVFVAHQIGGAIAAFGAAILRVQFGDYAIAFYISALLCLITSYFVLQIAKGQTREAITT